MSDIADRSYYSGRADQETDAGINASNPTTAAIHFELAYRYMLLSEGIPTLVPLPRATHRADPVPVSADSLPSEFVELSADGRLRNR